ncbi:MAG: transporter substrate-binding domain-containing protein, partial [Campylobacterota bacterium]|nr:transporter substrate-binding domain-containing protein [Campylobacterota bacterium]
ELNWPPYNFNINGQAKGFSIDYMNLVVSKLGIKAQYHVGPTWSEFLDKIKNEQLDVMLNIRNTPSRQKYIHFTKEYIHATKSIFTNDQNIQTVADLKGKTVAVAKGFFVHEFLKQYFPDINLNIQDNVLNCIIAVVEGQADAVVADYGVTSYLMQENGLLLKHTRVLKDERLNTTMHIGTSLKQPILRDILQKSMNTISDEEMQRLRNKWFTSDIRTKKQESILSSYELEYLKNKKEIRMCIDPAWLPFEGRDTKGNHIGLSADYFLEFKKHLDIEMKVVPTKSWTESLQFAQQKKCDILPLAMQTKEREKYLNFTQVYLKTALVIATKVGIPFVDDFRNLKNKKIGIPKGYAFVEIIKQKYPNINIIEVDNVKQGLQRVLSGELYGYVGTLAGINYQFQKESINELKIAGKFDEYWELGVGVRNDDIVLLEIFDKIIQNIEENTHHRILTKWMNIERETLVDYTLFWNILIVVLIAAVFFIYRQRMLNKLNRDLKQKVDEKTKQLLEMNNILEKKVKHAVHENHEKDLILFEQSKMASMGEMIGNIAHQWRQPLSVISTSATGIKLRKEYGELSIEEEYKTLDSINDAAQFLSKTIDDFRDFLKPHKKFNEFNIKDTYFKTYSLIKSKFKNKEIEIITNIHDVEIVGLENELMQVMMNLLNNAYDALDKQTADQRMMWIDLYIYNKQAIFEVKDNAGGIESSILHKVFEPYFTTKHQSQGTGIGLYMTQEIIVKHMNGTIEVSNEKFEYKSKQYNGANFKVSIPLEQLNIQ